MRYPTIRGGRNPKRSGKFLALFILLLPALLGIAGLAIDGGLLTAGQRQAQNAADAAALAAAMDLLRGQSTNTAKSTATTFAQTYNGLSSATVQVNVPPTQGNYQGNAQFAEVIVTNPVSVFLMPALGVKSTQNIPARAVAGYIAVAAGEGCAVLNPSPPNGHGLEVSGTGSVLTVNGLVTVNAESSGYDQNGNPVNIGASKNYAVSVNGGAVLKATDLEVVGGADPPQPDSTRYQNYDPKGSYPLHAGVTPEPDPLITLPTPTTSNGVPTVPNTYYDYNKNTNTFFTTTGPKKITISSGTVTVPAGIYDTITVNGSANVTFSQGFNGNISINGGNNIVLNPGIFPTLGIANANQVTLNAGIYVLTGGGTTALSITGSVPVTGNGVMFYNTASTYTPATGAPDNTDGSTTPPTASPPNQYGGGVNLSGSNITMTPLQNTGGPFDGMVFYSRRWNQSSFSTQGTAGGNNLSGTLYGKWMSFSVTGQGTYAGQFIVGSMKVSGGGNVTINFTGKKIGKANQVFLVE
jgi:hypothetical protein